MKDDRINELAHKIIGSAIVEHPCLEQDG